MSAGLHRGALVTLSGLARGLPRTEPYRALVDQALRLLQKVPDGPELAELRESIVEQLEPIP